MIKHSFVYSVFSAFVNSWNNSFMKYVLFTDFGLEEKFNKGFFGRLFNKFINLANKSGDFFAKHIKNSFFISVCNKKINGVKNNERLTAIYGASFFARLGGKVFSYNITDLCVFALAFLTPIVPTKIVLALCVVTVALFFINVFVTGAVKLKFQLMDLFVLMFLVLLTYSVFISYNMKSSAVMVAAHALFILTYFAVKNTVDTKEKLDIVISLIVLSGFFVAVYGVYQKITGNYVPTEAWIDSDMFEVATYRIYSTLDNPNVLGEYLLFIIPLAFAMLYYLKNNFYKLVAIGILGVTALCMIYTQSRGAWLGLIFAFALFALLTDKRLVFLGIVGLILLPLVMPSSIIERFASIGNLSDSSTNYRVNIWLASLLMIKRFWPVGIGLGTDTFVYIYRMFAFNAVYAPHSHNLYLQLVIDLGIFGFIIFIAYMSCFFKSLLLTVSRREDKFIKAVSAAVCAGMAGYLLQGLTDNVWYNYRVVALFWFLLAIAGAIAAAPSPQAAFPFKKGDLGLPDTSTMPENDITPKEEPDALAPIYLEISNISRKYAAVEKIVLFGSRARKEHSELSDIDIAVFTDGEFWAQQPEFTLELEEKTRTLLKYDIIFINDKTDEKLLSEIEKDGVSIYEKIRS